MIVRLTKADFSKNNIGELTKWNVKWDGDGIGEGNALPGSIDKGLPFEVTVKIASRYTSANVPVTVYMGNNTEPVTEGVTIDTSTSGYVTISIGTVTGKLRIVVGVANAEVEDDEFDELLQGYTEQTLDASMWRLAALTASGAGADGTSNNRLSYGKNFTIPASGRIIITCPSDCYVGVRNGAAGSMTSNQYWYRSGDEIQLYTTSAGEFCFCLARTTDTTLQPPFATSAEADANITTISKDIANNVHLYFCNEYTSELNATDYQLVRDLGTSEDNWVRATVSASGVGTEGSSTVRMAYKEILSRDILREGKVIMVTCGHDYCWAIRTGSSATSLSTNLYWFNSGTVLRLGDGAYFGICFKKINNRTSAANLSGEDTITKADAVAMNAKLYTAKSI